MALRNKKREANMQPDGGIDYLPEGIDLDSLVSGELPPGIEDITQKAIDDFCMRYKIEDLRSAPVSVWSSCCQYVGEKIYKRYRLSDSRTAGDPAGTPLYDEETLQAFMFVWVYFCGLYDKPPMMDHYYRWSVIFRDILMDFEGRLSPLRVVLHNKLRSLQEHGLADRLADGRRNALGIIAILNHWHGWNAPPAPKESAQAALPVSDLPKLEDLGGS